MSHTPGPWKVTDDGMYVVQDGPGFSLFNPGASIACSPSPHTWKQDDARLIAAAPRMLKILTVVAIGRQVTDGHVQAIEEARALLREIEGEEETT